MVKCNFDFMNLKLIPIITILIIILYGCGRETDIFPPDNEIPPAIPADVRITYAADGEIFIEWKENIEANLKGYYIYRSIDNSNDFLQIAFTTNNYYFDDSLNYGNTYYYRISAVNQNGIESSQSGIVFATPQNFYIPYRPTNLKINARNWEGKISIFLSWTPNPESDVIGYIIFRAENPDFDIDTSNYLDFTSSSEFEDKFNLEFYKNYYYKIQAVDKGNLISEPSFEVNDLILEIPEIYFPEDNSYIEYFSNFKINGIQIPAKYKIILQENELYGEIWSKEINSSIVNDTINIPMDAYGLEFNVYYYWRVMTFSNSDNPNSISRLYKFKLKQIF